MVPSFDAPELTGRCPAGRLQRYTSTLFITPSAAAIDSKPNYTMRTEGTPGTLAFRTFVQNKGVDISPWHDVSLYNDNGTLNFICEIPKDTTAKFEVATVSLPCILVTCMHCAAGSAPSLQIWVLTGRDEQPHQAGRQEGRPEALSLHHSVELRSAISFLGSQSFVAHRVADSAAGA